MSGNDIDIDGIGNDEQQAANEDLNLVRQVIDFCGGPDLVQMFGPTGSGKTQFCVELMLSASIEEDKDVLFLDTERNLSDNSRINEVDYTFIPEWDDLYAYISGKTSVLSDDPFGENTSGARTLKPGYDVIILDSVGLPALVQYDEYSIEDNSDQFEVFQMLQYMSGQLKTYAQRNDALIIVTNQPKSELADGGGTEPFGEKSLFAFKELWKTEKKSSSEIRTTCMINAHRSRQAGQGKELFQLEVQDSGTNVNPKYNETAEDEAEAFLG
jgi:RecA/RadA recombinase